MNHARYEVHKEPVLLNFKEKVNSLISSKAEKIYYQPNQLTKYNCHSNRSLYITYVVENTKILNPLFTSTSRGFDDVFFANYYDVKTISRIRVPFGAKVHLERKIPRKMLLSVHKEKDTAVELCLFLLSIISNKNFNHDWVRISSKKFRKIRYNYKNIIEVLKYTNGNFEPLIIVKHNESNIETYEAGKESKKFRLSKFYYNKNKVEYQLRNGKIVNQYIKILKEALANNFDNAIIKNIVNLYPRISFPTYQQMIDEAKRLIKLNYVTKKGKKLIFRKDFKKGLNKDKYVIVEDCIARSLAIMNNPEILEPSNSKAGGRVTYKLNLINSWIRHLIKIDNEEIVELDFKALHPNIAIKLYGGSQRYVTHQKIAEKLNIDVNRVKKQHLSYFNDQVFIMKMRKLHQYYLNDEPSLVQNIINDKKRYGYKITSRRMFGLEVQIMSEIIKILNSKGICLIYIYDALACKKSVLELVKKTMEEVVLKFGVFTTVSENYKYGYMENEENVGIVYKATNMINGYSYIGTTTKSIEERKLDHFQRIDKKYSSKFHDALKEYGKENFNFEVIDTVSNINELALKEKNYIKEFDSNNNGYNLDSGGGFKKMVYQFDKSGVLLSTFQSLEEAAKSVNVSKNSISDACLGGRKSCANFYWSYSPEIEIKNDNRVKKVAQYSKDGELINEFESIAKASLKTGVNKSSIQKCCNGARNLAGGYVWKNS